MLSLLEAFLNLKKLLVIQVAGIEGNRSTSASLNSIDILHSIIAFVQRNEASESKHPFSIASSLATRCCLLSKARYSSLLGFWFSYFGLDLKSISQTLCYSLRVEVSRSEIWTLFSIFFFKRLKMENQRAGKGKE